MEVINWLLQLNDVRIPITVFLVIIGLQQICWIYKVMVGRT